MKLYIQSPKCLKYFSNKAPHTSNTPKTSSNFSHRQYLFQKHKITLPNQSRRSRQEYQSLSNTINTDNEFQKTLKTRGVSLSIDQQTKKNQKKQFFRTSDYQQEFQQKNNKWTTDDEQIKLSRKYLQDKEYEKAAKILAQHSTEIENKYLLAFSLIQMNQQEQAVGILEEIIKEDPLFRKQMYLLISRGYQNLDNLDRSRYYLEKAIKYFPDYYEGLLQLAQVLQKLGKYNNAIKYYEKCLDIDRSNLRIHFLYADCYIKLKFYPLALSIYNDLLDEFQDQLNESFYIKYILVLIKCKKLQEAQDNIHRVSSIEDLQYIKALIFYKNNEFQNAIQSFEQVINKANNKTIVAKSIYLIIKIQIVLKDFYSAFHHLKRFDYIQAKESHFYLKVKDFVLGAICLMKRDYQDGMDHLSKVKLTKFIEPYLYLYKAYGYFCLSKYQNALIEYNNYGLDQGAQYNYVICEALVEVQKNNIDEAKKLFDKASLIFPNKMEPYFYQAVLLIQENYTHPNIEGSWKLIEKAFNAQGKSANLFYVRAVLKAYRKRFTSAIKDLHKAIDKSEDNVLSHYYLRGLLQAQQMRIRDAIKDFSTCIHFDKEYKLAYLQRSKCYQMIGEQEMIMKQYFSQIQAFIDLKKYIQLNGPGQMEKYWSGNLLFHNNAFEEAVKAYKESVQSKETQYLIIKCYLKMHQYDQVSEKLKNVLNILFILFKLFKQNQKDVEIFTDYQFINVIRHMSSKKQKTLADYNVLLDWFQKQQTPPQGFIFGEPDFYLHKACLYCYTQQYSKAIEIMSNLSMYWVSQRKIRLNNVQSQSQINTEQSEKINNQMILKEERIIQHIIATKYNLVLLSILNEQYDKAQNFIDDVLILIKDVQSDEINYIHDLLKNGKSSIKPPRIITILMNDLSIFNIYPLIRVKIKNNQFDCHLSMCLPDLQPPNICPCFTKDLIKALNVEIVENKPEAPWVKRENEQYVFTDNMYSEVNLSLNTEEDEQLECKKRQLNEMRLDKKVEEKLKQIIK